ncbi:MAG: methyltransferase domain-containing protein [Nostoc sp. NMS7]|nr:methyltransferase domain-containing protein [Nostoc sp. NMS7]
MRSQAEYAELVKLCYLDVDNLISAQRFASSDEFTEVKNTLQLSNSSKKFKILDLGCGNGIASFAFASIGHDVVAVDPDNSEDVGLRATERLGSVVQSGSISTVQAFSEALPFPDSTFDIVYARQALHHFSDLYEGLAECSRVLQSNGILFATREHVITDEKQLQEFLGNHILHKLHGGENAHTLQNYISAMQKAPFKNIRTFAPFDNIVNHFPTSNADVRSWLYKSLEKKLGVIVASILIKVPTVQRFYRQKLSHGCDFPGRLYSFLCNK